MDFKKYYIWDFNQAGSQHVNQALIDKPNKAIMFAPEEFELMYGWRDNNELNDMDLTVIVGSATREYLGINKSIPKNANVVQWPTYWINATYYGFRNNLLHSVNPNPNKLFVSLNNKAHNHRCMLMDNLFNCDLMQYGYISWHEPEKEYEWKYWKPELMVLDSQYIQSKNSYDLPSEFYQSLLNVVAESTMDTVFITEKTCTALLFSKPFIIFGAKNFHQVLKDMGFELYDELFDYSFDSLDDHSMRLNGIMENLNRLKNQNYSALYSLVKDKVQRNRQRMIDIATSKQYIPAICQNHIEYLKKNPSLATGRDIYYMELEKNTN